MTASSSLSKNIQRKTLIDCEGIYKMVFGLMPFDKKSPRSKRPKDKALKLLPSCFVNETGSTLQQARS